MRQACLVMRVLSGSWVSASSPGLALPLAGMAGGPDPELLNGLAMVTVIKDCGDDDVSGHRSSQLLYCCDKLRTTGPRISCALTIDYSHHVRSSTAGLWPPQQPTATTEAGLHMTVLCGFLSDFPDARVLYNQDHFSLWLRCTAVH